MRSAAIASAILVAGAFIAQVAGQDARPVEASPCSVANLQGLAPEGTTITAASVMAASGNIPRHCLVDGHAVSVDNTVNFRVGLPETWNGKFHFQGVGGLGGSIGSLNAGLVRGYASASTDTGHVSSDDRWWFNREKEIDYGHRGTHVATVAAKAVTAAYYGREPQFAYFNGCSNGGRQALMEVQRYPDDYDGVIGGHPATGLSMQVGRALVYQRLLSSPDHYLPAAKIEVLSRASVAACDATDGLVDGLVSDPRACQFQPETLRCGGADGPNCLTAAQVETVKTIYAGVRTPDGTQVAAPYPPGHEGSRTGWTQWITGAAAPTLQPDGWLAFSANPPSGFRLQEQNFAYMSLERDDPAFGWRVFNLERDLPRLRVMWEILTPDNPDLNPFRASGGKLIMYHGWSDPGISAYGTVDYYDKAVAAIGGQQIADEFVRLYMAPGMHHCGGGPGPNTFDMLPVLEDWVERGVAPTRVVASHVTGGLVDRTRPLCPHPQRARYTGRGSIDDAASFVCEAPTQSAAGGGNWLDRPLANWNTRGGPLPRATPEEPLSDIAGRCQMAPRDATAAERAVGSAGWLPLLHLDRQLVDQGIEIVGGLSGADGMCRPTGFNLFVFADGAFAGTLSPRPMSSRVDGVAGAVRIIGRDTVSAEFARYLDQDALCCPSGRMSVRFDIDRTGVAPLVAPAAVRTTREF